MRTIKSQTAKILLGLPFNLPQGIARIIRHEKAERDAQPPRSQSEGYTCLLYTSPSPRDS